MTLRAGRYAVIEVDDTGTSFTVYLPVTAAEQEAEATDEAAERPPERVAEETILVVEKFPAVLRTILYSRGAPGE